jgi:hypothetical protein
MIAKLDGSTRFPFRGASPRTRREGHDHRHPAGVLSALLANIALSVLDEHFVDAWE